MDIKETPVISFITICYNGLADTCALIDSLQAAVHSVSYEIIVVDYASRQNEAAVQPALSLCQDDTQQAEFGFLRRQQLRNQRSRRKIYFPHQQRYLYH